MLLEPTAVSGAALFVLLEGLDGLLMQGNVIGVEWQRPSLISMECSLVHGGRLNQSASVFIRRGQQAGLRTLLIEKRFIHSTTCRSTAITIVARNPKLDLASLVKSRV